MKKTKRILSVFLAIVLIATSLPMVYFDHVDVKASVVYDYVEYMGHSYKLFDDSMTWYDAKEACEKLGGHLIKIDNKAENDFITGVLENTASKYHYWTAITYDHNLSSWKHYDGSVVEYQNWSQYHEYDLQEQNEAFVCLVGKHYTIGAGTNKYERIVGEWLCTSSDGNNYGYICEWESDKTIDSNQEYIPIDYDFYNDSYSFENYSSTIPYGYFKTMYGAAKGWKLWQHRRNQGGLCFGFSYTTAAYFNNLPDITSVRSLSLSDWLSIGNNNLTVETYIKYAHIYQMSMEFSGNSNWSTAQEIYNIVKNCAEDDNIMCTIGMTHSSQGGHRVLAVGVEGNDILIDDPNNSAGFERLTVNSDGTWSFSGLNGWGSNNCRIRYSLDVHAPFRFIKTLKPLTVNNAFIDNSSIDEIASNCESEVLSKDYLLLSVDSDDYTISNSDIEVIEAEYELTETNESSPEMYWLGTDKTINFEELSDNSEISLSGNTKSVELFSSDSCSASLTVDEEQSEISALIDSQMGEEFEITVNDFDDNNIKTMTISGYANDDEVSLKELNNNIIVSGLNDVTVRHKTEKETLETEIKVNDGSTINITVNEEKNAIETDWTCKHINENEDDICDNCGAVVKEESSENQCSHLCHSSNSFLKFIWKVINFFSKLFGINPVCTCGAAHY